MPLAVPNAVGPIGGRRILIVSGPCFLSLFDGGAKHFYASRGALPPDARLLDATYDVDADRFELVLEGAGWDDVVPYPELDLMVTDLTPPPPGED